MGEEIDSIDSVIRLIFSSMFALRRAATSSRERERMRECGRRKVIFRTKTCLDGEEERKHSTDATSVEVERMSNAYALDLRASMCSGGREGESIRPQRLIRVVGL